MSVSLVSVLVSQPVLLCVAVLWYVTVFVSGEFWVRFWRGLQVVASVYWTSPLLNINVIIIIIRRKQITR